MIVKNGEPKTNESSMSWINQNWFVKMQSVTLNADEFEINDSGELCVVLASEIVNFQVALNALSKVNQSMKKVN